MRRLDSSAQGFDAALEQLTHWQEDLDREVEQAVVVRLSYLGLAKSSMWKTP